MNKKGLDISLNFIIIAALALIALIVIALVFTGGLRTLIGKQVEIVGVSSQEYSLAETACITACSVNSKTQWENPNFPQSVEDAGYTNCDALMREAGKEYDWEDDVCKKTG